MGTTYAEMIRRLERLDLKAIAGEALDQTKQEYIIQQKRQMSDGLYWTQAFIRPPYAESTINVKRRRGDETAHVTFDGITGGFKLQMFMDVRPEAGTFAIDSAKLVSRGVPLSSILEAKYTGQIWGIGGPYKANFIPYLREGMKLEISKVLNK